MAAMNARRGDKRDESERGSGPATLALRSRLDVRPTSSNAGLHSPMLILRPLRIQLLRGNEAILPALVVVVMV